MKLNLEFMLGSGTFLMWLGVTLGLASVALFFVSGGSVSISSISQAAPEDGSSHRSISCGYAVLGLIPRLVCLLPLLAGMILVFSGYYIRHSIHDFRNGITDFGSNAR